MNSALENIGDKKESLLLDANSNNPNLFLPNVLGIKSRSSLSSEITVQLLNSHFF